MKRLLYTKPDGTQVIFHHDEMEGVNHIEYRQPVDRIIEHNKRKAADSDGFVSRQRALKHVATIPIVLLHKWLNEDGIAVDAYTRRPREFSGWLMRKLRSNEYRDLRTSKTL